MSDEKIDLSELAGLAADRHPPIDAWELLALVAAVRAARQYLRELDDYGSATSHDMRAALAPFTDSAEVRDEG